MGALLSLPLLAVPSVGTVSSSTIPFSGIRAGLAMLPDLLHSELTPMAIGHVLCSQLLRRSNLLDGM